MEANQFWGFEFLLEVRDTFKSPKNRALLSPLCQHIYADEFGEDGTRPWERRGPKPTRAWAVSIG